MKPEPPPVYALIDHRQDGRRRIVGEFIDPGAAAAAAKLLRDAGAEVEVELIARIDAAT
jgi:hypothetical protein